MQTRIYKENEIHLVANAAINGRIIAFPTETVYGLGVIYDNVDAFNNLLKVKVRDARKPFTLMVSKTRDIRLYAKTNDKINALIDAFLPGELTLLLPPQEDLPAHVLRGSSYVGIRVSASLLVTNLISLVGKPLFVPSANKSHEAPALTSREVFATFNGEISAILEGVTVSHIPSTIVRVNDKIELVREGSIPFSDILKVWEDVK